MKGVAFYTLGCKVNQYETNLIKEQFEDAGYKIKEFEDKADIYIINSCSVTNLATRKSRKIASKAKKINPKSVTVMVGCYSELVNSLDKELSLPFVDIIVGNDKKDDLVDIVNKYEKSNNKKFKVDSINIGEVKKYHQKRSLKLGKNIRESIKIEDGCNNFCTYCIIPYTRGRVRSRNIDDIVEEVKQVSKNGVKEVVLVGIEIASYGKDLENAVSLIDVVERINEIDDVKRIRLGSIEPRWLTDENIIRLSKVSKLCNHFHLSVQSLSDGVLKRMNRKYTSGFIIDRVQKLRQHFENTGITCDIIVGFINETDEEFEETYNNAKKIKFSDMHVFKFSKRKGTRAYDMENNVDGALANERSEKLIKLGKVLKEEFEREFIGKNLEVLFDEEKGGKLYGYTKNYIKVRGEGENIKWGEIQNLEFFKIEKGILIGKTKQS